MNAEIEALPPAFVFDLSGGHLCMNFTNTLSDRVGDSPHERIRTYEDLVAWSLQASLLTAAEAQRLLARSEESPLFAASAARVHQDALALREALYRIFRALALDEEPPKADLMLLNTMLVVALSHLQIVPQHAHFAWGWVAEEGDLDSMLWRVVRSAADLLTSDEIDHVKLCMADDCGWLFLDASKNQSRRWCSMNGCGNRAKVRKHYKRKKQEQAS